VSVPEARSGPPGMAGVGRRWGGDAVVVVLADEAPLLRRQLLLALECHPRIEVAAEAPDADVLADVVGVLRPDVAVLGLHLPPDGAGPALAGARQVHGALSAVVVTDPARAQAGAPSPGVAAVSLTDVADHLAAAVVALADQRRRG
jgi:DNA-binding NarL/FixJ family response regulator